jgi:hypothetical protein
LRPDEIPCLQFPQGIRHIGACDPKGIRDIFRRKRLLGRVQQRVDLAHRSIDTPALAQVSPFQNELPDRQRLLQEIVGFPQKLRACA